eukprot:CAMPEP_0198127888 /NCGR_PEP_ID=MMETSP1442-20131203/48192_1 /TAXON_ID= /ORGANISM="Craspedostauros australis, Strain CCMP3328" /LENGTH=210 /DNA_ID=CAMNT_0043787957 /DNA_START=327 /DNA_END=956 /DNA_ORIENTATION=-
MSASTTSWRSLLEVSIAKSRKIRGSNYVQLSTVQDGEPRCRTVVFRGFQNLPADHPDSNLCDDKTCVLKMCTDLRSQKVTQNTKQPIAEMVWWFPKTSEQYRIRGVLRLLDGSGDSDADKAYTVARKELWGNMADSSRESFLNEAHPGEDLVDPSTLTPPPAGGRDEDGKVLPVPERFLLMLLDPTDIDYLCLTGDQYRQIDTKDPEKGW